jgi:hypothetical protein
MKMQLQPFLRADGVDGLELVCPTGTGGAVVIPLTLATVMSMAETSVSHVSHLVSDAMKKEAARAAQPDASRVKTL